MYFIVFPWFMYIYIYRYVHHHMRRSYLLLAGCQAQNPNPCTLQWKQFGLSCVWKQGRRPVLAATLHQSRASEVTVTTLHIYISIYIVYLLYLHSFRFSFQHVWHFLPKSCLSINCKLVSINFTSPTSPNMEPLQQLSKVSITFCFKIRIQITTMSATFPYHIL